MKKNKDLDVYSMTETKQPNIENEFIGYGTFKRNNESIIHLCKSNNINIIISTFAFAREEIKLINKYDKKFYIGLKLENKIIRDLSIQHNLRLIDNENLIPKDNKYFTDDIHFSHLGMKKIASNFADKILELIN